MASAADRETVIEVEGATCGACVARIESALRAVEGVVDASFNLATHRARVRHAQAADNGQFAAAITKAGYRVSTAQDRDDPARAQRTALWRTGLAGLAMMQVMMLAYPAYVADDGTLAQDLEQLLAIASLVLTLPVLVFCATPIWAGAWRSVRSGHAGMDVPVALGIFAALAASLPGTFDSGPVYYDSITMFVFFLSAARYFESRSLAATLAASEALAQLLPRKAVRLGATREEVDPASLVPGDLVWIAAGEAVPADCVLESGPSDFNEALLTGESAPASKGPGDAILAGSLNLSAPVEARVVRSGEDQALSRVRRLVESAAAAKPRWAVLADHWAGRFTVVLIVLAAASAAAWFAIEPANALPVAMAVLVVSCPCALSLAAPVALTACATALARRGVLVSDGAAIEALAACDRIVFDKTGTLTTGRLRIAGVDLFSSEPRERCLGLAAALERAMPHPIAHALVASGATPIIASALSVTPGAGVEAKVRGVRYRVGSAAFCESLTGTAPPQDSDGGDAPLAFLAREGEWLAAFRFEDTLRAEAAQAIERLRELHCEPRLLSGDREAVVSSVARAAGIDRAVSAASPQDKLRYLEELRASGAKVAMVGDGVNDAPSMAAAHVGIAMGQGAALARSQAGIVLANPSLLAIPEAIAVARRTRRVIAQNLAWAAGYNAIAIPLAVTGLLAPWMASLGMSLSSLLVVLNAVRIARLRAP